MDKRHWKILAQKNLYQNERGIKLEQQKLQLPNGDVLTDYYQIEMRDFVTMIIQDQNHNFLCLKQYKHGARKVILSLPGGLMEENEKPLETAARELQEETGYHCPDLDYKGKYILNGNQHICHSHIVAGSGAKMISQATNPDQEDGQICFLSRSEIQQALFANDFPIISHALAVGLILAG